MMRFCGWCLWLGVLSVKKCKGKSVPLQAWIGPQSSRKLRFPDFMTTAQDGGKVVSLMHRPLLPPGNAPGTHLCQRLSQPQGRSAIGRILCQRKIPMTPAGIEPAAFRFVAQHLNHCATAVPGKLGIQTNTSLRVTKKCPAYGLHSGGFAVRLQAVQGVSLLCKASDRLQG